MKKSLAYLTIALCIIALCIGTLSGCSSNKNDNIESSSKIENSSDATTSAQEKEPNDILTSDLSFKVEYLNNATNNWSDFSDSDGKLFGSAAWEPGYTQIVCFKIKNTSMIGFDWTMSFGSATGDINLGDAIEVFTNVSDTEFPEGFNKRRILDGNGYFHKNNLKNLLTDNTLPVHSAYLEAGETIYFAMALKMNESVGNEYHNLKIENISVVFAAKERLLQTNSNGDNKTNDFSITVNNADVTFSDLLPGDVLSTNPSVKNSGIYSQYMRVTVTVSDITAFKASLGNNWSVEALFEDNNWGAGSLMTLDSISEKNGNAVLVFYVNKLVAPSESVALYNSILFPAELTANDIFESTLKDGFTVDIFAEAVHTSNSAIKDAKSAFAYANSKR